MDETPAPDVSGLDVPLERDVFLRTLLRHLSGTLQAVVGLEEASGFISLVGQEIGDEINQSYKQALHVSSLSRPQVADVLVDLKRRIQGDFYIIEQDCMMTSNVFGSIAADSAGYARVQLEQTIAQGDAQCRVVVHFRPPSEANVAAGREYFKA
jgi:Methanogen output domain 1